MPAPHDDPFARPGGDLLPPSPATAVSGNGHGPHDAAGAVPRRGPARRRGAGPTVWPAAIVVGVALVVLLTGAIGGIFAAGPAPSTGTPTVKTAPGAPVAAVAARGALAPIETPGRPPDNVLDAVVLPAGAVAVAGSAVDEGVGLYDRSMGFTSTLSEAEVVAFYRAELPAEGWKVISTGPPQHATGYELLGRLAGTDGYFWELGATVSPTAFGSGSSQSTPFTLRLFAISDTT
ncbi:MAG TPA: hypothetical protein VEI83_16295 [Acidimicrobiales bacterium]|nr:hypothetical protein [Acidimicrobiales bacterium]